MYVITKTYLFMYWMKIKSWQETTPTDRIIKFSDFSLKKKSKCKFIDLLSFDNDKRFNMETCSQALKIVMERCKGLFSNQMIIRIFIWSNEIYFTWKIHFYTWFWLECSNNKMLCLVNELFNCLLFLESINVVSNKLIYLSIDGIVVLFIFKNSVIILFIISLHFNSLKNSINSIKSEINENNEK